MRSFSGARGAGAISGAPDGDAKAPARPPPSDAEIREAGELFLAQVFGHQWEAAEGADRLDAILDTPIDNDWVARRITRLEPCATGPMRLIPKRVWNLAIALAQPDWFELWEQLALRCPRDWLVQFCGVAMLAVRGALKSLGTRRVQSMLSLGVLAWQLAEYEPSDSHYPWVIRGLPYGAWQCLVAYYEPYARGAERHVPASTTLFGRHRPAGDFRRGDAGYITAWKDCRIATTHQPSGFDAPPDMAGEWKTKIVDGVHVRERWAFVEVRLRIRTSSQDVVPMGPLPPPPVPFRKRYPFPAAMGDLAAAVDEFERELYGDEAPPMVAQPAPAPHAPASAPLAEPVTAPAAGPHSGAASPAAQSPALAAKPRWLAVVERASAIAGLALGFEERPDSVPSVPCVESSGLAARPDAPPEITPVTPATSGAVTRAMLAPSGLQATVETDRCPDDAEKPDRVVCFDEAPGGHDVMDIVRPLMEHPRAPGHGALLRARAEVALDPSAPTPAKLELDRLLERANASAETTVAPVTRGVVEAAQPPRTSEVSYRDDPDAVTLVSAASLEPGAFRAPESEKFLTALASYKREQARRDLARRKRKPPS